VRCGASGCRTARTLPPTLHAGLQRLLRRVSGHHPIDRPLAIWSSLSRPDAYTGWFPVAVSLEFKGELKRWPMLSMVCDKECLVLFHGLCQLHKIGLRELSRQEICPAIRLHCILHHPLVVIR